jgi:hypothetical protein
MPGIVPPSKMPRKARAMHSWAKLSTKAQHMVTRPKPATRRGTVYVRKVDGEPNTVTRAGSWEAGRPTVVFGADFLEDDVAWYFDEEIYLQLVSRSRTLL